MHRSTLKMRKVGVRLDSMSVTIHIMRVVKIIVAVPPVIPKFAKADP